MEQFEERWLAVENMLQEQFGKKPDMEAVLFLIGMNEFGNDPKRYKFTKEEKQDLMHVAVCTLLSQKGYYRFDGRDDDGWPHFTEIQSPQADGLAGLQQQEQMLKECIIQYFDL